MSPLPGLARLTLIVICAVLLAAGAAPAAQRVVAIGDIHGDFDAFVGILQRTGLVGPGLRWSGGNATLVQTG
ncbi:MAG TPA: metallophosphatase, partial [Terriglobia bacterium]|nr:metallophosphatase [Terriglobia bacterium]